MKKMFMQLAILTAVATLCLTSCKKGDTGPAGATGPAGPQGPQGPQGVEGNANVTMYTFGAQNLSTIGYSSLQITTTEDSMTNSSWEVYLYYDPNGRWYSVPGFGIGGSTNYRVSMGYSSGTATIYIDKASGPGEDYLKAKVARVYASSVVPSSHKQAGTATAEIDFADFNAVRKAYHFSE